MKLAGILDPIRDQLAPDIWTSNQKLRPRIRRTILERIRSKYPPEQLKEVFIIGSITGYQYGKDSDVDINVSIVPEKENAELKTHPVKDLNGKSGPGSHRAINFFIQEYYPDVENNYKKAKFGVYDVIENKWINRPKKKDPQDDPDIKFGPELRVAREKLDEFNKWAKRYFNLRSRFKKTLDPGVEMMAKTILHRLWRIAQTLENERKMAYRWGWGVPRESFQNIAYKLLQDSRYGNLFKELESYDSPEEIPGLVKGYTKEEFKTNQ